MGDTRKSRVKRPSKKHGKPGQATLDSEDLEQYDGQTPAYHEGGHMLGLGDEYPGKKFKGKAPSHSKLVRAEFGKGVLRGKDDRIMSHGNKVEPEHGVTFLEALREVTQMKEWSVTPKTPAAVLSEPVDGPLPKQQDPLAPEDPEAAFASRARRRRARSRPPAPAAPPARGAGTRRSRRARRGGASVHATATAPGGAVRGADLAQPLDQRQVPGQLRLLEALIVLAPVVVGERADPLGAHRPAEQAGRLRRVDDHADVVLARRTGRISASMSRSSSE